MCRNMSRWLKKRTIFPRTIDTMLGWFGLLLFFLIWLGERTQIDTTTQIPDKLLHGQWHNIIWIDGDGMNILYSWFYWFGILILIVFLWRLIRMLIKGEKLSSNEEATRELTKEIKQFRHDLKDSEQFIKSSKENSDDTDNSTNTK